MSAKRVPGDEGQLNNTDKSAAAKLAMRVGRTGDEPIARALMDRAAEMGWALGPIRSALHEGRRQHHKQENDRRVESGELGLLYRISRVMSQNGCDVDLVLIATEGHRAIDVFHITKAGQKLSAAEQAELSANLQRVLEDGYEAD